MRFQKFFTLGLGLLLFFFLLLCQTAQVRAVQPVQFSADRQVWNRRENWVELFGNARVRRTTEVITADYIWIDLARLELKAEGRCRYTSEAFVLVGKKMTFQMEAQTGVVDEGFLQHPHFSLSGKRIVKRAQGQFQAEQADYTTCQDCESSWSVSAKKMDLVLQDYLSAKDLIFRVKDTPVLWLPYFLLPTKTERQTGFLFPSWSFAQQEGWMVTLPFFWALHRSADMTITGGYFFNKGPRFQWEGRYQLSERSGGEGLFSFLKDPAFDPQSRWSLSLKQIQELPSGFEFKANLQETSDNLYPYFYPADLGQPQTPFLRSQGLLSQQNSYTSLSLGFTQDRSLLVTEPGWSMTERLEKRDSQLVQAQPALFLTTRVQPVLKESPWLFELATGLTRFTRSGLPYDFDDTSVPFGASPLVLPAFRPGIDPIRRANRFFVFPAVYSSWRIADAWVFQPRFEYRGFFYDFQGLVSPLFRGYLLCQLGMMTQLERVYDFPDSLEVPRAKHLVRPLLTYSYIPTVQGDTHHPFLKQIQIGQQAGWGGYFFDQQDLVPREGRDQGVQYLDPVGHALAYGLTQQWIQRRGRVEQDDPLYRTVLDWQLGQAFNFLEWHREQPPGQNYRWTRFFSQLSTYLDDFTSQATYYYYPSVRVTTPRHVLISQFKWFFARATHERLFQYERSLALGYVFDQVTARTSNLSGQLQFSLSDYWMPFVSALYDVRSRRLFSASTGLLLQSPSACWRYFFKLDYLLGRQFHLDAFNLSLNFSGTGFTSAQNWAGSAPASP